MTWKLSLLLLIARLAGAAGPFTGRWDITLKAPSGEFPSWIEFSDQSGTLAAQMVGRWGNARPLPTVEAHGSEIVFVSPKREEGGQNDMVFHGTFSGWTDFRNCERAGWYSMELESRTRTEPQTRGRTRLGRANPAVRRPRHVAVAHP